MYRRGRRSVPEAADHIRSIFSEPQCSIRADRKAPRLATWRGKRVRRKGSGSRESTDLIAVEFGEPKSAVRTGENGSSSTIGRRDRVFRESGPSNRDAAILDPTDLVGCELGEPHCAIDTCSDRELAYYLRTFIRAACRRTAVGPDPGTYRTIWVPSASQNAASAPTVNLCAVMPGIE